MDDMTSLDESTWSQTNTFADLRCAVTQTCVPGNIITSQTQMSSLSMPDWTIATFKMWLAILHAREISYAKALTWWQPPRQFVQLFNDDELLDIYDALDKTNWPNMQGELDSEEDGLAGGDDESGNDEESEEDELAGFTYNRADEDGSGSDEESEDDLAEMKHDVADADGSGITQDVTSDSDEDVSD